MFAGSGDCIRPGPCFADMPVLRRLSDYAAAQTAAIVEDYTDRPVRDPQTKTRILLRLLVVVVLVMFLAVAIILLLVVGVSSQRTTRIYSPEVVEQLKSQQLSFGNTSEAWLCPCQQSQQAFSQFLHFRLFQTSSSQPTLLALSNDTDTGTDVESAIKTAKQDCIQYAQSCKFKRHLEDLAFAQVETACGLMLGATTSTKGTSLSLPYLSKPSTVWQAAGSQAQDAIVANSAFQVLLVDENTRAIWWCIEDFLYALIGTWLVVSNSTQTFPTAQQFINIATMRSPAHMPFNQVFSFPPFISEDSPFNKSFYSEDEFLYFTPEAVPMLIFDWDAYVDGCSVPYCDVTKKTSVSCRVFSTFSQVGGILTIALLVVRMLIWPTLVWLVHAYESRHAKADNVVVAGQHQGGPQLVAGPPSDDPAFRNV